MSDDIDKRISALEHWRNRQETVIAVQAEQQKHMDARFDRLEKDNNEIKAGLMKVAWTFGAAIIVAVAAFVVSGGLKVG